jgi:hypothetical protein
LVKNVKIIHKWLLMSKLYISGSKVNISIFYRSGLKFKDVNIIYQWQNMSKLDTSG